MRTWTNRKRMTRDDTAGFHRGRRRASGHGIFWCGPGFSLGGRPSGSPGGRTHQHRDARAAGGSASRCSTPARVRVRALHADDRFPMCSTFKLLAAAAVLKRVDEGKEKLDRRITLRRKAISSTYSPITEKHVADGMTLAEHLRGGDDAERQHRRQSDPGESRRAAGHHRVRALARRHGDAARPHRADAERSDPRRSARHHDAERDARQHRRRCVLGDALSRGVEASN